MDSPNFDIGMAELISIPDFSSSGDEMIRHVDMPTSVISESRSIVDRFDETTEEERNKLLLETDAHKTNASTKIAVKTFKSRPILNAKLN